MKFPAIHALSIGRASPSHTLLSDRGNNPPCTTLTCFKLVACWMVSGPAHTLNTSDVQGCVREALNVAQTQVNID